MSWISDAGNDLSGAFTTLTSTAQGLANAGHTLLGSGGMIYANGQPLLSTGVTQGDTVGTNTNINLNGVLSTITGNPILLIVIAVAFFLIVIKK